MTGTVVTIKGKEYKINRDIETNLPKMIEPPTTSFKWFYMSAFLLGVIVGLLI